MVAYVQLPLKKKTKNIGVPPTIIFSVYLPWVTDFFGDFADGGALQPTLYSLAGSPKTAGRDAKRNNYQMKP